MGTILCGPTAMRLSAVMEISLSPPRPMVFTSMARTIVRHPPTSAPCSVTFGRPLMTMPRSVVVPPMSDKMKLSSPDSHRPPTRLAAGPDSTVSMGRLATASASASVPSPLTIISGQCSPNSFIALSTASMRIAMREMSRALRAAVSARRGASSSEESSLEIVTGFPVVAMIASRARRSCAGLRTANCAATANASTPPPCSSMAAVS